MSTARRVLPYAAPVAAAAAVSAALHAPDWPVLLAAGVSGGIAIRAGWEQAAFRHSGGSAAMRRRKRYQGAATSGEIGRVLSPGAARRHGRLTRPSLAGARRVPVTEAGVPLGRTVPLGRVTAGSFEQFYALFGIARSGKTGAMSRILHGFPGAALVTSTRTDIRSHTLAARRELAAAYGGQVLTLAPGGAGMLASDFACSPLQGCADFTTATASAGYLMTAAPKDPGGSDSWIDDRGAQLLRVMMHAAAIAGADMLTVLDWVRDPRSGEPMSVLTASRRADPEAARSLHALLSATDGAHLQSVIVTADTALSWLSDPVMRRAACPADGSGLDVAEFIATRGTVYLAGTGSRYGAADRYFAWFASHLFAGAKKLASVMPGGRLDPPLGMVIDEPALTCRVPLDQWSAEAGGHGVTVITGFQSFAQLAQGWGEHGGKVIFDNAVKIILGGFTAGPELEAVSAACGTRDTWHHVHGPGGKTRQPGTERLFPPERIRTLRPGSADRDPQALLLYPGCRPFMITVPPVWRIPGWLPAGPEHHQAPAIPALEAGHPPMIEPPAMAGDRRN